MATTTDHGGGLTDLEADTVEEEAENEEEHDGRSLVHTLNNHKAKRVHKASEKVAVARVLG